MSDIYSKGGNTTVGELITGYSEWYPVVPPIVIGLVGLPFILVECPSGIYFPSGSRLAIVLLKENPCNSCQNLNPYYSTLVPSGSETQLVAIFTPIVLKWLWTQWVVNPQEPRSNKCESMSNHRNLISLGHLKGKGMEWEPHFCYITFVFLTPLHLRCDTSI